VGERGSRGGWEALTLCLGGKTTARNGEGKESSLFLGRGSIGKLDLGKEFSLCEG